MSQPMSKAQFEYLELERSLTNITPNEEQVKAIEDLRAFARAYGQMVVDCPDSREKSLAKTKLEESVMWAVKSIILHHPSAQEFVTMDGEE